MNKVIYRCAGCGSTDIEGRAWVHLNNRKVTEDTESEALCNDCEFMGKPKIYSECDTDKRLATYGLCLRDGSSTWDPFSEEG